MKRFVLPLLMTLLLSMPSYGIFRDSVLVLVRRNGYQVDVVKPGRYIVVRNYGGKKVEGKFRVVNHRTLIVGHTIVPVRNIKKLTVKSSMYPISRAIYKGGNFFVSTLPKKILSSISFGSQGPAALLLFFIFLLVAVVSVIFGLLIMFVALPGLVVGKTYDTKSWKIYIKPKRS